METCLLVWKVRLDWLLVNHLNDTPPSRLLILINHPVRGGALH